MSDGFRVVVVSGWYPSDDDPLTGVFVEDQVAMLRETSEVDVFVPEAAPFAVIRAFLVSQDRLHGVRRIPVPRTQLGLPLRVLVFVRALARLRAAGTARTVVHAHLLLPNALPALLAARIRRWPFVVSEHVNFLGDLLASRRARIQVRLVLRFADAVVAVGDRLEEELLELEPRARVATIPNPLDLGILVPVEAPSRDFVLNVAIRLGEQKGTDILLRSWAELSKHERLPDLVIVGDGPERSDLERLASRLGIGEATRFVGTLARPELVRLFQHAAFVVSASREETFGLAAVEALACGTPVVATRTGEARTFGPDLGLTVDPDDIEELGRAIAEMARTRQVYDSQHLHDEMGRRYGRDVVRRQLLALYGDLIRARS